MLCSAKFVNFGNDCFCHTLDCCWEKMWNPIYPLKTKVHLAILLYYLQKHYTYGFRNMYVGKQGCKNPSTSPIEGIDFYYYYITKRGYYITYPTATYTYVHQTKFFEFRSCHCIYFYRNCFTSSSIVSKIWRKLIDWGAIFYVSNQCAFCNIITGA